MPRGGTEEKLKNAKKKCIYPTSFEVQFFYPTLTKFKILEMILEKFFSSIDLMEI
jgi:hypothetical protein